METVLQGDESHTPDKEPVEQMATDDRSVAEKPDVVDANRAEELARSVPTLRFYHAEKFRWAFSSNGTPYLEPLPVYLSYVEAKTKPMLNVGIGMVFPDGEHDQTDEAAQSELLVEAATNMREILMAIDESEAKAFDRYLSRRCTDNAVYAVNAQFELKNWAERLAEQGKDAGQDNGYCDKESRRDGFARRAGTFFNAARDLTNDTISLDNDQTFISAARRIVYQNRDFAQRDVQTPVQIDKEKQASIDVAKDVAEIC